MSSAHSFPPSVSRWPGEQISGGISLGPAEFAVRQSKRRRGPSAAAFQRSLRSRTNALLKRHGAKTRKAVKNHTKVLLLASRENAARDPDPALAELSGREVAALTSVWVWGLGIAQGTADLAGARNPRRFSDPVFAPKQCHLLCSKAQNWALTFTCQNHLNRDLLESIK